MGRYLAFLLLAMGFATATLADDNLTLLDVSYDPTRELYNAYNPLFAEYWKHKTGQDVTINQSHGGSGTQARAVLEGLRADVVTLALSYDIDMLNTRGGFVPADWQSKLPHNSAPYTSTIVFLVRKGNPKQIKDWDDLVKDGIEVITPNPKTSGGARWNYLAGWGYAMKKNHNDENAAKTYIGQLFSHVPVLDTGARGAATTFARRKLGDVLIAWENEALLLSREKQPDDFDIVYPSISIYAEPPVAVVEKNTAKRGTTEVARAYLEHLYASDAQEIIAQHFYRPSDPAVMAKHTDMFPLMPMLNITDFGGWKEAQKKHFAEGGVFDQIYMK